MPLKSVSFQNDELIAGIEACSPLKERENRVRSAAWDAHIPGGEHMPKINGGTVTVKVPSYATDQAISAFEGNLLAAFAPASG